MGLPCITFKPGKGIDGNNREVHFQARLRAFRIGKVWDGNLDGFTEIERPRLLFDDAPSAESASKCIAG